MATVPAKDLLAATTNDEMMELSEGQELFSSNLFRLQLAELLAEVRVNYKKAKRTNALLHTLKDALQALPTQELSNETIAALLGERRLYGGAAVQAFTFRPPTSVNVTGSFLLHSHLRGAGISNSVDVLVEVPDECFHQSDVSSYKYHDKRNAYILQIAKCLKNVSAITDHVSVSLACMKGDPTRCFLRLTRHKVVKLPTADNFDIHIYPVISKDLFRASKLAVSRNNVRLAGEDSDEADALPPTPFYNNAVLEDASMTAHLRCLHENLNSCPAMRDALILMKVWLRQREFDQSEDSLNGFLVAMLMAYLVQPSVRKINKSMSSYQIFKVTLDFLANGHILQKGISFSCNGMEKQIAAFSEHFEVVFLDQSGNLNLMARVSRAALEEVSISAKGSMALLESDDSNASFEALFLTKIPFHLNFDAFLFVRAPFPPATSDALEDDVKELLRDRSWTQVFLKRVREVLGKGLGKRVNSIAVRVEPLLPFNPLKNCSKEVLYPYVTLGLAFDAEYIYAANTVGPSADAPDADDFRSFWGDKSELVRFADGQILEVVDWDSSEGTRHLIVEKIAHYTLARHLSLSLDNIVVQLGQLDDALLGNGKGEAAKAGQDRSFTWNLQVCEKFEKLATVLRKLGGLPLAVNNVLPAHSALAYSHAIPILRHALLTKRKSKRSKSGVSRLSHALEIVLQLEGSGQWPDDIVATRKLLSAFLVRIGNSLESEHSIRCTPTETYVDIFYGGHSWRLSIYLEKYIALIEQQVSIDAARPLRVSLQRKPALVVAMRGLQHSNRVFGETARLAKRWAASNLLMGLQPVTGSGALPSCALSEQAVELLVARLFLDPSPYAASPRSRICGFARFLHVLATHPWASSPYIVDLNQQLTQEQRTLINNEFQISRGQGSKSKAMFIASPLDTKSDHWTGSRPTAVELVRIVAAADRSLSEVEKRLTTVSHKKLSNWRGIFRPHLEDFDAIIVLEKELVLDSAFDRNRTFCEQRIARMRELQSFCSSGVLNEPTRSQACADAVSTVSASLYRNMQKKGPSQLLVGFNPLAHFVSTLESHLGEVAIFQHGGCGESVIGVVWRPGAFLPQQVKPKGLQLALGSSDNTTSAVSVRSVFDIIHDIRSIGAGMVHDIVLVSSEANVPSVR